MNKKIVGFTDLIVYQNSYRSSIEVMKKIVPKLPNEERYDLTTVRLFDLENAVTTLLTLSCKKK